MKYLKSILQLLFFSFLFSACSVNESPVEIKKLSHDFVLSKLSQEQTAVFSEAQIVADRDCLTHIQKISCVSKSKRAGFDPACSHPEVKPEMLIEIPKIISDLPELHKKVFCHLDRLQIHSQISSIAYASVITDFRGQAAGNMIGIRLDALTGQSQYDLWSWKEQLNFGLSKPNDPAYTLSAKGPFVEEHISGSSNTLVLHVLAHEMGHLIDFMNQANQFEYTMKPQPEGEPALKETILVTQEKDSFGLLSWPATFSMDDSGNSEALKALYPWLSQLCYYGCKQVISPDSIPDLYQELNSTSFVSSYSASSPMEDFAESLVVATINKKDFYFRVLDGEKAVMFDTMGAFNSSRLVDKRKWLKDFLARPHLKYKFEKIPLNP